MLTFGRKAELHRKSFVIHPRTCGRGPTCFILLQMCSYSHTNRFLSCRGGEWKQEWRMAAPPPQKNRTPLTSLPISFFCPPLTVCLGCSPFAPSVTTLGGGGGGSANRLIAKCPLGAKWIAFRVWITRHYAPVPQRDKKSHEPDARKEDLTHAGGGSWW